MTKFLFDQLQTTNSQPAVDSSTVPALAEPQLPPELQAHIEQYATQCAVIAHKQATAKLTQQAHNALRRFPTSAIDRLKESAKFAKPIVLMKSDLRQLNDALGWAQNNITDTQKLIEELGA